MADPIRIVFGDEADFAELRAALGRTVSIQLADPSDWNQQLLLLALLDLLRRVLPCVRVELGGADVAAHPDLPPGPDALDARVEEVAGFGCEPGVCADQTAVQVVIGAGGQQEEPPTLHVDGRGWQSFVGTEPAAIDVDEGANAIGPLTAACRAASAVVRGLLAEPGEESSSWPERAYWDALAVGAPTPTPPDRAPAPLQPRVEALLMGCGSIGGAAAYALARTPGLEGALDLLDAQALEPPNQSKAILARPADAVAGRAKVEIAEAELAHLHLDVDPQEMALADYVAGSPAERTLPLVLCAVDSVESRRELQDCLPLEVVNAACDGADVFVSGHLTDAGPCVYCLHIERVLNAEAARIRLIEGATGIPARAAAELIEKRAPLNPTHLTQIERHRKMKQGALARYRGATLDRLYDSALRYGEEHLDLEAGTRVAIPAPWVTALAGFLLAAEALKHGQPELREHCLGPTGGLGIRYYEDLAMPSGIVTNQPPRFPGQECLCNDPRRLRLLHERYRTSVEAGPQQEQATAD